MSSQTINEASNSESIANMGSMGVVNGENGINGHFSLPDKTSTDIFLVEANPEERYAQLRANSVEWQGTLPTVETYVEREDYLAAQELARDGGLITWLLVYAPAGEKRKTLCGCETFFKKALFGRNGKVEEAMAVGVGSVFCPKENRGKGYAGRMIHELGKTIQNMNFKDGKRVLFSLLWSDIGKKFYSAYGWQAFPSAHLSLRACNTIAKGLPPVRFIPVHDLPEYCALDEQMIRARMAKSSDPKKSEVALIPDARTMTWHHAREEFFSELLHGKRPMLKGAVVGEVGSRVWLYWSKVWTNPGDHDPHTLHILRLVIEDPAFSDFTPASPEGVEKVKDSATVKAVAALFAAARTEAKNWDMKEVQMWNPTSTTLAAARLLDADVVVEHRDSSSICSLRWFGEGSWEDVDWICNEKYGWC